MTPRAAAVTATAAADMVEEHAALTVVVAAELATAVSVTAFFGHEEGTATGRQTDAILVNRPGMGLNGPAYTSPKKPNFINNEDHPSLSSSPKHLF